MSTYKCVECGCIDYPNCTAKSQDSCQGCIDGASGFHLKILKDGQSVADIPDYHEECYECGDYYELECGHLCKEA